MFSVSVADLYPLINQGLWPLFRILALFSTAPFFSEAGISKKVKVGLAVLITALVAPLLPDAGVRIFSLQGLMVAVQQLLIGVLMGLTVQFIFVAVKHAGEIIGMQMGLSFATFYDPSSGGNMPVVARLLNLLVMLLFLTFNGHLWMLNILVKSFTLLPIGDTSLNEEGFFFFVKSAGIIFSNGILLGLPVITLLLCINLTLGLLNRLTPQLSIFVIGFPLTLTVGMGALALIMYTLAPFFENMMASIFEQLAQLLMALGGVN
ncbi:flagellar biosynthetic protein FliR [Scandinavium sp.]|uniref:flagellar biosynthetic protein FliR n=1 Tax=Scandinavium sp. TaxID=2830653 RepID=UPI0028A233D6|nr:flagellar biosynthetic protein FliR [Scandinavium sp.]